MNDYLNILYYLLGVNIVSFIIMGIDKRKAKKNHVRIPERTLWGLAILGGAIGSIIGMNVYRHKTKHRTFVIGMPALVIIHFAIVLYIFLIMS